MLLTAAPFTELSMLVQGILWIVLPLLFFSLLVTVLIHYGRKRKAAGNIEENEIDIAASSPENFCFKTGDGKLVFLDHTGLLRDFRRKLSYSNARFAALKQDITRLRSGEKAFALPGDIALINYKTSTMEKEIGQMQLPATTVIEETNSNNSMTEQDPGYLHEILQEKKIQIEFLQQQVEAKVKKAHIAEQEKGSLKNELEELKKNQQTQYENAEQLKAEIQQKDDELMRIQHQLNEKQQLLNAKQDQLIYIENQLQDSKQQNELFAAAVADGQDRNEQLIQQLQQEASRVAAMENKLFANKQLLQRLYNEFSACLNEEQAVTAPGYAINMPTTREWGQATA